MAHEIDMSNERANMAYVGDEAWHGLGQKLTQDADLETWRREAGMDWHIIPTPVLYNVPKEKAPREMLDRKLFFRSDNKAPLSVVSNDFKIVQPGDMLEFYRDLTETAGFKLETAGCLFGGRKFWALARAGNSARIMGQDEIKPYLLIASACDGSMATSAHFTSVRVVCNNTLRMAIGPEGERAKIRVPHNAEFNHDKVKNELGIIGSAWENFLEEIQTLAKTKIHRDDAIDIVAAQLKKEWRDSDGNELSREEQLGSSAPLRRIISLFDGAARGAEYRSSKGTAWGLLNAVTEYYDHEAGSKIDRSRAFERAHLTDRANFKVAVANEMLKIAA